MAKGLITKRAIEALAVTGKQHFLWDAGLSGFGVRVTPKGVKSYVFQFRLATSAANARRMTIGKCSEMAPNQARGLAMERALLVRQSIDPLDAKAEKAKAVVLKRQSDKSLAFDSYCDRYLELRVKPEGLASAHNIEAVFRLHSIPHLKQKPLLEIKRQDVVGLLDRIPNESIALKRSTYAILNKMFNWAKSRDDIAENPMEGMRPPPPPASRDRVLSDNELALALKAAMKMDAPFGPLIRLLFATGQRRDECAALNWSELNKSEALWTLPAARSKNGKANIIPLNHQALAVLDQMASIQAEDGQDWPSCGFVFTTTGTTPVSGYSRAKKRLDGMMQQIELQKADCGVQHTSELSLKPWRLHDARRTLATGLQRLGVRFEVTEAILNHTGQAKSGVAAVYQRYGWAAEKRAALDAWADHCGRILELVDPTDNIVPIRNTS